MDEIKWIMIPQQRDAATMAVTLFKHVLMLHFSLWLFFTAVLTIFPAKRFIERASTRGYVCFCDFCCASGRHHAVSYPEAHCMTDWFTARRLVELHILIGWEVS